MSCELWGFFLKTGKAEASGPQLEVEVGALKFSAEASEADNEPNVFEIGKTETDLTEI